MGNGFVGNLDGQVIPESTIPLSTPQTGEIRWMNSDGTEWKSHPDSDGVLAIWDSNENLIVTEEGKKFRSQFEKGK